MAGQSGGAWGAAPPAPSPLAAPSLRAARTVLGLVVALAAAGAGLGIAAIVAGDPATVRMEAPDTGAWAAATSFGVVEAERLERTPAGAHASVHGGALERVDRVTVSMTLTNRLDRAVPYSPGLLRLRRDATGTTIAPFDPHRSSTALAAGETAQAQIAFLVPAGAASFTLQFDDLERGRPAAIALGTIAGVPGVRER